MLKNIYMLTHSRDYLKEYVYSYVTDRHAMIIVTCVL